ncbi:uncharacterized protein LOC106649115 [Trichogramma pretiosum]|uniref:uncharacterized protein LOC106649115 n=1 Tax=Trichogramma pretiosum TaxID=7493 RepID=UPI000C71B8C3|nr:uncharacterized protein LOC106649115 [Trichogramma pretiosum]
MKRVTSIPAIIALVAFHLSLAFVMEIGEAAKVVDICGKNQFEKCVISIDLDGTTENENTDVVVREINMDLYAVCLLKKASLMDEDGKVRLNFDILKVLEHLYEKQDSDQLLGLALIARALQKCRRARGKDRYFKAANIVKCLLDNQGTTIRCAG